MDMIKEHTLSTHPKESQYTLISKVLSLENASKKSFARAALTFGIENHGDALSESDNMNYSRRQRGNEYK